MMRFATISLAALLIAAPAAAAKKEFAPAPQCTAGDDCEVKWGRAITWVMQRNPNIAQRTDDFISTVPGPTWGEDLIQINRIPLGGGRYQIMIRMECSSILKCSPRKTIADFVRYVNDANQF